MKKSLFIILILCSHFKMAHAQYIDQKKFDDSIELEQLRKNAKTAATIYSVFKDAIQGRIAQEAARLYFVALQKDQAWRAAREANIKPRVVPIIHVHPRY